jgi:hypothetical protein
MHRPDAREAVTTYGRWMAITVGSRVSWNTEQGRTRGKVVERKVKDFTLAGHRFRASEDEPKLLVESDKTGARAAHAPSALRELKG